MALSRCVAMPATRFHDEVFGRRHLHTQAAALERDFTDLFSPRALEELLSGGLRTSSLRVVRDGAEGPMTKGCVLDGGDAPGAEPFPSTDAVRGALAAGHTLVVRSLHRFHAPLRRFAHQLAADVGHPVRINAFVTPPSSQGVDLHFDVQDVLVLQVTGEKLWELRTPPLPDPLPAHAWFDVPARRRADMRAASEPLADVVLRAGDSLYLPRGTFHAPRTRDRLSLHLTVAITKTTHHDLLTALVRKAVDEDWLRRSVSLDALEEDDARARDLLAELPDRLAAVAKTVEPADLLRELRRAAFRDIPPEPLPVLPDEAPPRTYRIRQGVHYRLTADHDDQLLTVDNRQVRLPPSVRPVLARLREDGALDAARLRALLGEDEARQLAGVLVDIGLLTPVA